MGYKFNGKMYDTEDEAVAARNEYQEAERKKAEDSFMAFAADYASVGGDENKLNMLLESGGGLSQMSDAERDYIKANYTPTLASVNSYKNNVIDQYLASVGLPSSSELSKYRTAYGKYSAGGGIAENYGGMTDAQWGKITDIWKKDWQYGTTNDDLVRQAQGLAPVSYDSMYEDTLLDDELKQRGLPPSKLLNGKLGETYNAWVKDANDHTEFMDTWLRQYIDGTTLQGEGFDAVRSFLNAPTYTMEDAYRDTLEKHPELQAYATSHFNNGETELPDRYDDKYIKKEKANGVEIELRDENGQYIYDEDAWAKDYNAAIAKNAEIAADEFGISFDSAREYYVQNGQQMKALMDVEREFAEQGKTLDATTANEFMTRWNDRYTARTLNDGEGYTIELLFPDVEMSDAERAEIQPYIDYANKLRIEQGYEVSREYLVGGQFAADLKKMSEDKVIKSYRDAAEEAASAGGTSKYADWTDDQILNDYYGKTADSYLIPGVERDADGNVVALTGDAAKIRSGELTIDKWMSEHVTDDKSARDNALERAIRKYESLGLPTNEEEFNQRVEARQKAIDKLEEFVPTANRMDETDADRQEWQALYMTDAEFDANYNSVKQSYAENGDEYWTERYATWTKYAEHRSELKAIDPTWGDGNSLQDIRDAQSQRDRLELEYYVEAVAYTPDFAAKTADMDYVNQRFEQIVTGYSATNADVSDLTAYATDDERRALVYLADSNGTQTAVNTVIPFDENKFSRLGKVFGLLNPLSDTADTYLNKVLLHRWDNMARADKAADTKYLWSDSDSWFLRQMGTALTTIGSIGANIGEGVYNFFADTREIIEGNELLSSQRATWGQDSIAKMAENISERHWSGDYGSFVYQLIPSTIQSGVNMWLAAHTGGASKFVQAAGLTIMSMEAYSSEVDKAIQNGASPAQAYMYGIAAGVNEYLFEKVSLDSFLAQGDIRAMALAAAGMEEGAANTLVGAMGKGAFEYAVTTGAVTKTGLRSALAKEISKRMLTHGLVEATEEFNTGIANQLAEAIILGYNSSYNKTVDHYVELGMSREEAEEIAYTDVAKEIGLEFVGGLVSGMLMVGGQDLIQTRGGKIFYDKTGFNNFYSTTRDLSLISAEDAINYAKANIAYDPDGTINIDSARDVFENLRKQGADAATLSRVRNAFSTAEQIEANQGAQAVMATAIRDQRRADGKTLIKAANQYVYSKANTRKSSVNATPGDIAKITNEYLDALSGTVQPGDIRNIALGADALRAGYINDIVQKAGRDNTASVGMTMLGDYFNALDADTQTAVRENAKKYIGAFSRATNGKRAGMYANAAAILEHAVTDSDALTGLNSVFGKSANVSSEAIVNACLNDGGEAGMEFINRVCSALSVLQTQDNTHLFSAAQNGVNSTAYVASQMALAQSMPENSMSRAMYDYIVRNGADSETMDLLTAANICDAAGSFATDIRRKIGTFRTTEQLASITDEYNNAKTNYDNKQKIAQAHTQADTTEHTEHDARIAKYAEQITELQKMMENADSKTLKSLVGQIANATSEMQNSQAALNTLLDKQNQRATQTQADLEAAETKYKAAKNKYWNAMLDQAAQYLQRFGATMEAIKGRQAVSKAELRRMSALVRYGTEADLNDINNKIIAAEKAAAVALGRSLGSDVQCVEFNEKFRAEKKIPKADWKPNASGMRYGGTIYLNTAQMKPVVGSLTNQVLLHEIGHFLEESADDYKKFRQFAKDYFTARDGADAVDAYIAQASENADELAAEFARQVALADPRAVNALCKSAPKMSMRVFQWLTRVNNRMSTEAASQSQIVRDAQRAFARGIKAIRSGDAVAYEHTQEDAPRSEATRNAEKAMAEVVEFADRNKTNEQTEKTADTKTDESPKYMTQYNGRQTYDISKPFEQQVEDFVNGKIPYGNALVLGEATEQMRGIGASNIPMLLLPGHLAYNTRNRTYYNPNDPSQTEDHIFVDESDTPEEKARKINAIREAIYDPVAIITSTNPGRQSDSIVMILDVKSVNGKRAIAAVEIDGETTVNGKRVDGHTVSTVHGRNNAITPSRPRGYGLLEKAFADEANNKPSVLYWNKNKVNALTQSGLKMPTSMPDSPYPHKITDQDVSVKPLFSSQTETQQFKRWLGKDQVDSADDVVYKDGEWFYKNKNGQLKSAEKNVGTFDADIKKPNWYTEYDPATFNAKEHDAEYMELAERYINGTASNEDVMKLRALVDAQALHQGVERNDFDDPLDLYHGSPSFGFTEFDLELMEDENIYTSVDPFVARGYTRSDVEPGSIPQKREILTAIDPRYSNSYFANMSANSVARRANSLIENADYVPTYKKKDTLKTTPFYYERNTGEIINRYEMYRRIRSAYLLSLSNDDLLVIARGAVPDGEIRLSNSDEYEFILGKTGEPMTKQEIVELVEEDSEKGIYHLYGFAGTSQYRMDAEGSDWEDVYDNYGSTPREIAANARGDGYTSTRIDRVSDPGSFIPGADNVADELIFYRSSQVKSADLVTIDDDKKIIPLSERFNQRNKDIRYYTEYDPQSKQIQTAIDAMSDEELNRTGNPRLIQTEHGFVVARNVSREGLITGNPMWNKTNRNMAMIAPVAEFYGGDVGRTVPLGKCVALVTPNTDEYASVRADARGMGVNVYPYNASDPTALDRAVNRAALQSNMQFFPEETYEDFINRYGKKKPGAQPRVENRPVPNQTSGANRVSDMVRNAAEAPVTTNEGYGDIQSWITRGTGTYTPISNARTLERARGTIERAGSLSQAAADLHSDVANDTGKATDLLARAELLYVEAQNPDSGLTVLEREQIFGDMCIIASDAGRALQAASMLKRMTPDGHIAYIEQVGKRMAERYQKRTKKRVNLKLTDEEKQRYHDAVTEEERQAIDKDVGKRFGEQVGDLTLLDRIRNWRYFSMLGNPRTHFRNIVGNLMMTPVARMKDTVNAGLQAAFRIDKADRTTVGITKRADAATRAYVEEQLKAALPVMQGVSSKYLDKAASLDDQSDEGLESLWKSLWKTVPSSAITKGRTVFGLALNKLSSFNSNALEAEDAKFLGLRFRSAMYQIIQARDIDVTKITPEEQSAIVNYASQEALKATFRDASAIADAINRFARTNRGTQFLTEAIIPFKKTPINIVKRGIEYSPLGLVNGMYKMFSDSRAYKADIARIDAMDNVSEKERADMKRDAMNTYKAQKIANIDRLASGTTGSILTAIGYLAASMGWISIGRKDDDEAAFEQSLGKNAYSLNIGDLSIDLSAFAPSAIPLLMGTALYESIGAERDDGLAFGSALIQTLCESIDPVTEMSMLSGIAEALKGMSYAGNEDGGNTRYFGTIMGNAASSYIGQFIPTVVGQIARVADPYQRSYTAGDDYWATQAFGSEVGTVVKSLQNKIPFVSWLSEPKVDLHGNPVRNYTNAGAGLLNVLNNFVLPATIKVDSKNEIDDELVRLYGVVDSADIFPQKPSRNLGSYTDKNGKSVPIKITSDAEYTQYQKEYGQTVYDMLDDLMSSMAYQRMTDEQKAQAIEKVIDNAKTSVRKRWKAQKIAEQNN